MLMKEKFIKLCKSADAIIMGGIVMKYYSYSNSLSYRIFGEEHFVNLNEIPDDDFSFEDNCYILTRANCNYKFKFYKEII